MSELTDRAREWLHDYELAPYPDGEEAYPIILALISEAAAAGKLRRLVNRIADQPLTDEDRSESDDYEGAYDAMIRDARAATDAANALEGT